MARTRAQRPMLAIVVLALLTVAVVAAALFVGALQHESPPLFRNGVIALAKDGDIFVADRPGGDLRPLVAGPEDDRSPMFSPDGMKLAFQRWTAPGATLMVADADGTHVVQLTPPDEPHVWSFAPDGRSLMTVAAIDDAHSVVIRPVDPAAALTVLDLRLPGSAMVRSWATPTFNPTNAQEILVVAQLEPDDPVGGGLYVYDLATRGVRTIVEPAEERWFKDLAWLPDGKHIIYNLSGDPRVVAADGSGDQALGALRPDHLSPLSNDGTRIVIDVLKLDRPGDDSHQTSAVVPIDGKGQRVELACGPGTRIECAWSWIWSPDDSILIGTVPHETSTTYLQADPDTGQVTELDWVAVGDVGTPAWQRVAP